MIVLTLLRALLRSHFALAAENLALRQQLAVLHRTAKRPRLRARDRLFWVLIRRAWSGWRSSLLIVRPATVTAWHRQGWRLFWRRRSRPGPGRPVIPQDVRDLIRRLSTENRFRGAARIRAELERLGHGVAQSTVEKYMLRRHGPSSPTWRAFLQAHAQEIIACDFFAIPTASFKSSTGLVVMELVRRRILACGVSAHPTAHWAASVLKRALLSGGCRARFLLRDRDCVHGAEFSSVVRTLGLRQFVTAYKAPRMNAHAERLIGTLRRECLDHLIVLGEGHARRQLAEYATYYNESRCHQALSGDAPLPRDHEPPESGPIFGTPVLGGLHYTYRRAA